MGFVHTAALVTDEQGRRIGCWQVYAEDRVWRRPFLFLQFLEYNHDVVTSSVVARHDAYAQAGRFDETLLCADFEMWLRMAFLFDVGYLATPLMSYRRHRLSTSALMLPQRFVEENRLIVDRSIAWAATQLPGLTAKRESALAAVDRVWAARSLRTSWALLAEGSMAQAATYLELAGALDRNWRNRCYVSGARACLNPVGHQLARLAQAARRRILSEST